MRDFWAVTCRAMTQEMSAVLALPVDDSGLKFWTPLLSGVQHAFQGWTINCHDPDSMTWMALHKVVSDGSIARNKSATSGPGFLRSCGSKTLAFHPALPG